MFYMSKTSVKRGSVIENRVSVVKLHVQNGAETRCCRQKSFVSNDFVSFSRSKTSLKREAVIENRVLALKLQFQKTYGNIVYKPYSSIKYTGIMFANPISSVSQSVSQSVSCSILGNQAMLC